MKLNNLQEYGNIPIVKVCIDYFMEMMVAQIQNQKRIDKNVLPNMPKETQRTKRKLTGLY